MHNSFGANLIIITVFLFLLINGCGDEYYSMDDFQSIEKIDTHVHINTNLPVLIEQAREYNFRLLTVNVDAGGYPPITEQLNIAYDLNNRYHDTLAFLTTIPLDYWDDPDKWQDNAIQYLEESFAKRAIGVKVWKNIGMELKNEDGEFVMIDDPQFDPVIEYLIEREKPLIGHIGEPYSCWQPLEEMKVNFVRKYYENHPQYHMYLHPANPSYEEIIESRNNMLDKHPDLLFVGAHMGSMTWSIDMMSEHLERYPNMTFDMAHRIPLIQHLVQQDRQAVRDFFIKYQDRLVYSTDLQHHADSDPEDIRELARETWIEDWQFFVTDNEMVNPQVNDIPFQGLQLPKSVVDKLYRENAERSFPGF
jgi:predicted TIM-barrel fold metal-dependent hydrolase